MFQVCICLGRNRHEKSSERFSTTLFYFCNLVMSLEIGLPVFYHKQLNGGSIQTESFLQLRKQKKKRFCFVDKTNIACYSKKHL